MKTIVFACNTIRDELLLAESHVGSGFEIVWAESSLHNFPDKLRGEIQQFLDGLKGYDRVLLAFGFCGGTVAELRTHAFEMILPRIDDCISLMIGSVEERERLSEGHHCIYLTKGWIENESNIWSEYQYTLEKYGEKTAQFVIDEMFKHHDILAIIDNGAFAVESIIEKADMMAERFDMACTVIPGNVAYFERLLTGPYDEELFICVPHHSVLPAEDLQLTLPA